MRSKRTVALLIESSRAYGRGLLRGIARYLRNCGRWSVLHQEGALGDAAPAWLRKGACDGVIARIDNILLATRLRRLAVPVVDLRLRHHVAGFPGLGTDDRATARLAADHLLERGFRHIGFCGLAGVEYSTQRRDYFRAYLRGRGREPLLYSDAGARSGDSTVERESEAARDEAALGAWLASLPKPIGLMSCNDIRGRQVLRACRSEGIAVPDEVAVVGVDNDEVLCELADPPLSSVIPATDRIGYEAAQLLDDLMGGKAAPARYQFFEPLGVMTRRSTDALAVEDSQVAAAIHFIRDHAGEGINVEDVLDHLAAAGPRGSVSRSTLDRRFAHALGRSAKNEILRVRLQQVRQLLMETDYSLEKIAGRVGIEHAEHLNVLFKKRHGETPGSFRRRMGKPA